MSFEAVLLLIAFLATVLMLLMKSKPRLQEARKRFVMNRSMQERMKANTSTSTNDTLAYDTLIKLSPEEIISLWKKGELSRSAALSGLAGKGVSAHSVLHEITDVLDDLDVSVRLDVLAVLEGSGVYAAAYLDTLIPLLKDNDRRIRTATASVIAAIGPDAKAALPELIDLLYARDVEVRMEAVRALGSLREWDATLPHFETLLQKGNTALIEEICWALEKADEHLDSIIGRILPVFKKYPGSIDPDILSQCDPEVTGPFLTKHAQSESKELSILCLKAMAECDITLSASIMDHVIEVLESGEVDSIGAAIRVIRAHPSERGLEHLNAFIEQVSNQIVDVLGSDDRDEIDGALRLISEFDLHSEELYPYIILHLENEEARLRGAALHALIHYKDDTSYPLLSPLVKDESPLVRATLARVLAAVYSSDHTLAPLLALLRDKDSVVRAQAARALTDINERSPLVRTHYLAALDDTSREVRREAALGLAHFDDLDKTLSKRCIDELRQIVIEGVHSDRERARAALLLLKGKEAQQAAAIGNSA